MYCGVQSNLTGEYTISYIFRNEGELKMSILYCSLYYSLVGLLIYSVFAVPLLVGLISAQCGYYPPKWKRFWMDYADIWLGFFKLLSPSFRRSIGCSMRPMTEEDRKEIE